MVLNGWIFMLSSLLASLHKCLASHKFRIGIDKQHFISVLFIGN